jgi:hydroxymethylpyrimidine pyrophosphatase-like HAD family hydrolase
VTLPLPHQYQNSTPKQPAPIPLGHFKTALFTDIDDTFIARGKPARLLQAAHDLHVQLQTDNTALILVTGTTFEAVQARIVDGELPVPEAIIASVGTDIWLCHGTTWQQDKKYVQLLQQSGYKKSDVMLAASQFIAKTRAGYELTFQQLGPGNDAKVSLHFMASHKDAAMLAHQASNFFAPFKIVMCEEIHANATLQNDARRRKFCLDIVPATKADAVSYLINTLNIRHGFKAGDSGNDVDMLLNPDGLQPILVGGYKREAHDTISPLLTPGSTGPLHTLQDGRRMYIESGERRAAESIAYAITLLRRFVYGEVASEGA